ncbi:rhodanese-like domain-containing protein [Algoriphagus sp. A40]|uniref:rhodanese-like domain-containing protein n=1 Tax=Algoriphagus sp. A40 TaxID=1945863 RepID=UPI0009859577|nr:rhodanese-like domain-containing protein [Algoriphagus sp. A40]OOG76805.1 hypothetical protein B0E43_07395 [Algoriphagus sp. A40]
MKNLLILLASCFLAFTSCESKKGSTDASALEIEKATATNLDPVQFQEKSANGIILDVRTPEEVAAGKISGAITMDFQQSDFLAKVKELPKDQEIYIYCAVGGRSSKAAELFIQEGFTKVYHLSGGINAWAGAGLPVTQE